MGDFLLCIKEWWILTGVTVINIGAIIQIVKWRKKMGIEKICIKIINYYNKLYDKRGLIHKSELRPTLIKEFKLNNRKAIKCIKYLMENHFIIEDRISGDTELWWINQ